jgi:hypothetical protein
MNAAFAPGATKATSKTDMALTCIEKRLICICVLLPNTTFAPDRSLSSARHVRYKYLFVEDRQGGPSSGFVLRIGTNARDTALGCVSAQRLHVRSRFYQWPIAKPYEEGSPGLKLRGPEFASRWGTRWGTARELAKTSTKPWAHGGNRFRQWACAGQSEAEAGIADDAGMIDRPNLDGRVRARRVETTRDNELHPQIAIDYKILPKLT